MGWESYRAGCSSDLYDHDEVRRQPVSLHNLHKVSCNSCTDTFRTPPPWSHCLDRSRSHDIRIPRGDRRRGIHERRRRRHAPDVDALLPADRVDRERSVLPTAHQPVREDAPRGVVAEQELAREREGLAEAHEVCV